MNTRQLYRYLFSPLTEDEINAIPEFFKEVKDNEKFRGLLRVLNISEVEKKLYGNATDEVVWVSYFSGRDFNKNFARFNDDHQYLANTSENIKLFQSLSYIFEALLLYQNGFFTGYGDDENWYAYQTLVYFGTDNNAENICDRFDQYRIKNDLIKTSLSKVFPKQLKLFENTIQLSAWQQMIAESNSPDAISLFSIAPEIEKVLGRAPRDMLRIITITSEDAGFSR